jgi:hypothetical protein
MVNLLDSIKGHCADLDPALLDAHFRRMPASYFERYSAADIARHLRLLAGVSVAEPVAIEVRPLGGQVFEIVVACANYSGTLACITTALAADHFDLEDVQLASYVEEVENPELSYSIVSLRVLGPIHGKTASEIAETLRQRLQAAFQLLARGQFLEAQAAASAPVELSLDNTPAPAAASSLTGLPPVRASAGMVVGGDYRLERRLAFGGMSEIYLATQISLDRTVAVKIARQESSPDSPAATRFSREAVILAQFQCPYLVPVLAAGTVPSGTGVLGWIAMEYQAGGDVAHWLEQQGPPPIELGLRWFRQALEGMRYAHKNAVLHRDLKPHNLLLSADNNLKVGDFGLFKRVRQPDPDRPVQTSVLGTPYYMAPEQTRGEHLDERSDIFSLGTTFFHIFSGRLPYEETNPAALMQQIAHADAPRLGDLAAQLPLPLTVLIGRMMARRKEERYQEVGVILEDLMSYESRGLLRSSESGAYVPLPPARAAEAPGEETQAYAPAAGSEAG